MKDKGQSLVLLFALLSLGLAGCGTQRPVERLVQRFVSAQTSGDCALLSDLLAPDQRPAQPCDRLPAKYRLLSAQADRVFVADEVMGVRRVVVLGAFSTGATGPAYTRVELEVERWSGNWLVSGGPRYYED